MLRRFMSRRIAALYDPAEEARRAQAEESRILYRATSKDGPRSSRGAWVAAILFTLVLLGIMGGLLAMTLTA